MLNRDQEDETITQLEGVCIYKTIIKSMYMFISRSEVVKTDDEGASIKELSTTKMIITKHGKHFRVNCEKPKRRGTNNGNFNVSQK